MPKSALLTQDQRPSLEEFGPYVVCKPDAGAKGAEVKIKRTGRVRWTPPANNLARRLKADGLLAQEFIYTGPWPVSYRVTTLFGKALFSCRVEADRSRRPLQGPDQFRSQGGGMSICSSGKACTFEFNHDRDVIELGERAHAAFPHIAVLGVDIIREQTSGKLHVIEVQLDRRHLALLQRHRAERSARCRKSISSRNSTGSELPPRCWLSRLIVRPRKARARPHHLAVTAMSNDRTENGNQRFRTSMDYSRMEGHPEMKLAQRC